MLDSPREVTQNVLDAPQHVPYDFFGGREGVVWMVQPGRCGKICHSSLLPTPNTAVGRAGRGSLLLSYMYRGIVLPLPFLITAESIRAGWKTDTTGGTERVTK